MLDVHVQDDRPTSQAATSSRSSRSRSFSGCFRTSSAPGQRLLARSDYLPPAPTSVSPRWAKWRSKANAAVVFSRSMSANEVAST